MGSALVLKASTTIRIPRVCRHVLSGCQWTPVASVSVPSLQSMARAETVQICAQIVLVLSARDVSTEVC